MADYRPNLKNMMSSVSETLQSTGDFKVIEPGCRLPGALNEHRERQIYLELAPPLREQCYEGNSGKILLSLHHDVMPGRVFLDKLIAATNRDIHSANVLYRYPNSRSDPDDTQGPFFRRNVLEGDRKKPGRYQEKSVYNQRSILKANIPIPGHVFDGFVARYKGTSNQGLLSKILEQYPFRQHERNEIERARKRVNNYRKLRDIEKDWAYSVSLQNMPLYFQPRSDRLDECIKRYQLQKVKRAGVDYFGNPTKTDAADVFEPLLKEAFGFYSIQPFRVSGSGKAVQKHLATTVKAGNKKSSLYHYSQLPGQLLLADVFGIPEIFVANDYERRIRYNLGMLLRAKNLGLDYESLEERISIQVEQLLGGHALIRACDDVISVRPRQTSVWVPSESRSGLAHLVSKDAGFKDEKYSCTCEDYSQRVKKGRTKRDTCKHIDKVRDPLLEN